MTHFLAERTGGSQAALINRAGTLITTDPQTARNASVLTVRLYSTLHCRVYWRIV